MLRSLLFVPGDNLSKIAKATQIPADALIFDWEDSVLPNQKESARRNTREFLRQAKDLPLIFVRVNPVGTSAFGEDSLALQGQVPDCVMLSKSRSQADVRCLEEVLNHSGCNGRGTICPLIESPEGLMNAASIARDCSSVSAMAFGAEDFSAEMEIRRTEEEIELLFARSTLVTACRAAGKQAIDSPCVELNNPESLQASARRSRNLGFTGKLAIHPNQIDTLNQAFMPSEVEVEQARQIVSSLTKAISGALAVDGRMVDEAVVRRARQILRAAGQTAKSQC